MRTAYVETYGCSLNHADTALMKTMLARAGYEIMDEPTKADVVILNTCTVRLDSEERMRRRILELRRLVEARRGLLVVAGCMAAAQPYTVKKLAPNAVLVSPQNTHRVLEAIGQRKDMLSPPPRPKTIYIPDERIAVRGGIAEVPLVDGCLGDCSFCITKIARRQVLSRPMEKILEFVRRLVRIGAVEIRLTGQDVAVYGIDIYGRRMLPELLRRVSEIPGRFMIRVGMMSPDQLQPILDEFIDALRSPKIYKFVHIPLQSGDDKVLRIMGRRYTVDEYRGLVKELRAKMPGVTIATDIMVGHPGEDEEAFENTMRLVEELRFERVHVAQYTPRPRTVSAGLPQIPDPIKKSRSKKLMALVERIGLEEHRRLVGSRARVVIVSWGERGGGLEARLYNYVQAIVAASNGLAPGVWRTIEITEATWYDVRGVVVG
ncbi:MAG: tRNA (N(6)-L-threonylcarbamoyladenosine(37)-C(2))-methylthiotransferase [Pyrodictiaceae archaeon]